MGMRMIRALAVAAALCATSVHAQTQPDQAEAVLNWTGDLLQDAYAKHRLSGAGVTVVHRGQVVGYRTIGWADTERKLAVDPQRTTFLIGSLTKTFTGVAIAQLMAEGRIKSLDDPANLYLKRTRLPDFEGRPIRIRDLLAHAPGTEEHYGRLTISEPWPTPLTSAQIKRMTPAFVRRPGEFSQYSNFGSATLGLIVEDVSGQSITDYYQSHIFTPLGMKTAQVFHGLEHPAGAATPFSFTTGKAYPWAAMNPFYYPAGGIHMSLADAGAYMRAQLGAPEALAALRLSAADLERMQTPLMRNHPASPGFGFQLMLSGEGANKLVEWGGNYPGYQAVMVMAPGRDIGVFIVTVGDTNSGKPPYLDNFHIRKLLLRQIVGPTVFADHILPNDPSVAGEYLTGWRTYISPVKVTNYLPGALVTVRPAADGSYEIYGQSGWRHVGGQVYENRRFVDDEFAAGRSARVGFRRDSHGVWWMSDLSTGMEAYERQAWHHTASFIYGCLIAGLAALLLLVPLLWRRRGFGLVPILALSAIPVGLALIIAPIATADGTTLIFYLLSGAAGRWLCMIAGAHLLVLAAWVLLAGAVRQPGRIGVWAGLEIVLAASASVLLPWAFWVVNLIGHWRV
jgi:CubicO group peptidase (beta-lactamase class C family)